jgi:hypothetical protein
MMLDLFLIGKVNAGHYTTLITFLIIGGVPAYYINKYLVKWLQPKQSARNLSMYIIAASSTAIIYAFVAAIVIWKFVLDQ